MKCAREMQTALDAVGIARDIETKKVTLTLIPNPRPIRHPKPNPHLHPLGQKKGIVPRI